jgi:hypothetical protein
MVFRLHDLDPAARLHLAAAADRLGADDLPLLSHLFGFGIFLGRLRPGGVSKQADNRR